MAHFESVSTRVDTELIRDSASSESFSSIMDNANVDKSVITGPLASSILNFFEHSEELDCTIRRGTERS